MSRRIFVFGSNLAGIHGAGSAKEAHKNHGAVWGCGFGYSGNSFAIPTKDHALNTLSLQVIEQYIIQFLQFADLNSDWQFDVVDIGCGLAGYKPEDTAGIWKLWLPHYCDSNINFLGELKTLCFQNS